MKKLLMTAAACVLLMTTAAQAKMVKLGNHGAWSTEFWTDDGNGPMCAMTTWWRWPNGAIGTMQFKWQNDEWFTHMTKSNWHIPSGTQIGMTIWLDNIDRPGVGTVHEDQTGGSTIHTGFKGTSDILEDVASAKEMKITFDSGTEPAWITKSMNGSRKAVASLNQCIAWVKANGPTQPGAIARTQPTQPMPPVQPTDDRKRVKKDDGSV